MKKEYMKPTMKVVLLQHRTHLLQASRASTNLAPDDALDIDEDTPAGTGFWGR
jgi:hypothetical protein